MDLLMEHAQRYRLHNHILGTFLPKFIVMRAMGLAQQIPTCSCYWRMEGTTQHSSSFKRNWERGQVQDNLHTDDANIKRIVVAIGNQELSVKNMMDALDLKGRDKFLNLYLNPAINEGFVRLLYPDSPRHPRQKYLLTVKGLAVYNEHNKPKWHWASYWQTIR